MPLIHFLIVFDRLAQRLLEEPREFEDADQAAQAYADLERLYRADPNIEVVLVGSDSLNTVKQTHSNYFGDRRGNAVPFATPAGRRAAG